VIFVVIPTFNRKEGLLRCLAALASQDVAYRTIISDSGSTDGTADAVNQAFPDALVLKGHSKLFWTGAVCLGPRFFPSRFLATRGTPTKKNCPITAVISSFPGDGVRAFGARSHLSLRWKV
jgi:hypothetical protein